MEQTIKITNVLSDPTRFNIYQFITKEHREVTAQEIADNFDIHPNVARLHLSKLEDVKMLASAIKKTGKGGRPSRFYRLSDNVIELQFPYRDYKLLAKLSIQAMQSLGLVGKKALLETGKRWGSDLVTHQVAGKKNDGMTLDEKLELLKEAAGIAGFYPEVNYNQQESKVILQIHNCPFKEVATQEPKSICQMHYAFVYGMFTVLFNNVDLIEKEIMTSGCATCNYEAVLVK
ncbi:helix-turn-helix transcriptional regulator [Peribacillus sp. SCS-155]|uniref:helix-turn-helix transcriptional regulator n=1 Tax=Peribacillus sedimenti TaxID=3115297 RepID=UPI0039062445